MATRDLYINLKPDSLTGAFVVSHKNGAPYVVPTVSRQEQLALRLFFLTPNPTGGFSSPFTIEDVSAWTLRVAIGTPGSVLAGPGSWTWDAGNSCWTGTLDCYTTEMEDALDAANGADLTGKYFEVELTGSSQRYRASQKITVKQSVLTASSGLPSPSSDALANALFARLLGEYRTTATTSNATPAELLLSDSSRITLADNSATRYRAVFAARDQTNGDAFSAELRGLIKRGSGAASVSLVADIADTEANQSGDWVAAASADTTNGALKFTITGDPSHSVHWSVAIQLVKAS
jgi:hypothetical protein